MALLRFADSSSTRKTCWQSALGYARYRKRGMQNLPFQIVAYLFHRHIDHQSLALRDNAEWCEIYVYALVYT